MMTELFNMNQFNQWLESYPPPLDEDSCIGYRIPLFLGGPDSINNMEKADRSVYLHMLCELWRSTSQLPQETSVERVELE